MADQPPILSIRRRSMNPYHDDGSSSIELNATLDRLVVMAAQDASYRCRDYLGRRMDRQCFDGITTNYDMQDPVSMAGSYPNADDAVDALCREKMCEWSYRVCDHFHTSREIVAIAFSFLDRFIDRCSCDRTAFKLASMTALYMATKMFNSKQISIGSLAELSRGEFGVEHIAEMERVILETLEWRMNPPTAQSFIEQFRALIPSFDSDAVCAIILRASFFAELGVYDYAFVTEDRYLIATACMLNAMEGLEELNLCQQLQLELLASVRTLLCVEINMPALEHVRSRLWFLYSCSAQAQHDDLLPLHICKHRFIPHPSALAGPASSGAHSPVSVNAVVQGQY